MLYARRSSARVTVVEVDAPRWDFNDLTTALEQPYG